MWEASLGIFVVIAIMLGIGLLASPSRGATRVRTHRDSVLAGPPETAATNLNADPDTRTALEKATTEGVPLGVSLKVTNAPPTSAEKSVLGGR